MNTPEQTPSLPASPELPESEFKRELRYLVVKLSDANKYLSACERDTLERLSSKCGLARINDGKRHLECVVIESDWPEYEPTWAAIEARMSRPPSPVAGLPTPETDAVEKELELKYETWAGHYGGMRDHARSLERRLAAARAEVEAAKEQRRVVHEDTLRTITALRSDLATAKEERDAALRGVETLRQNSEAMKRALKIHPKSVTSHIAKLESDLAKANAAVEEAKIVNESLSQSLTNSHRRERQVEEAHKLANERAASLRAQLAAQQKGEQP